MVRVLTTGALLGALLSSPTQGIGGEATENGLRVRAASFSRAYCVDPSGEEAFFRPGVRDKLLSGEFNGFSFTAVLPRKPVAVVKGDRAQVITLILLYDRRTNRILNVVQTNYWVFVPAENNWFIAATEVRQITGEVNPPTTECSKRRLKEEREKRG